MTEEIEFKAWPKTPRLNRGMIITEKIDGTNAAVIVTDDGRVAAQSRKRIITPGKATDNYGFAGWVYENAGELADLLGPGHHYGEWYGQSIQRRYGLEERRFALFNVNRYKDVALENVDGLETVPELYRGDFCSDAISTQVERLRTLGSVAVPGWETPEGIIVFHCASGSVYKVLLENDELPKGVAEAA